LENTNDEVEFYSSENDERRDKKLLRMFAKRLEANAK